MQNAAPSAFVAARSARAHLTGLVGEAGALGLYEREGGRLRAARWRCPEGEIDLVVETASEIVFVEVKARRDAASAAAAVSPRQWARIGAAASRYLAERTDGTVPCRFDLVTVDGMGRARRIENAASFDEW